MDVQRRTTRQRQLILDTVKSLGNHPTADAVVNAVRSHDAHVGRGTVYRNLKLLSEEGLIRVIKAPGGNRFDARCDEHAHAICTSCGAVADIELPYREDLDRAAGAQCAYRIDSHYTLFEGVCPACRAKEGACPVPRTQPDEAPR